MTPTAQTQAAATFATFWADRGDEKQETSRFWIDLLQNILGIDNPAKYIEFEKRVKLSHTSFIDAYIPDTKVLIERKGAKIDLHKKYAQSDGEELTPYEQAKRYADEMPNSLRPRWIVVCNFQEFLVYDLEKPHTEPEQIYLKDLEKEYYRLQFLADAKHDYLRREEELSLQAGVLVGKLYDALIKQYINPKDEQSLRSLNILCVRLVFCLYAEDAGLFATRTAFEDYIRSFSIDNARDAIIKLFKALDTKLENRDRYDLKLQPFPYVNGGLFEAENIEIPNFTDEIVDVLCNHCAPFNWSDISPTIFGAVFESTLNPETRRKGGMHYTSVQNIHKVIDPLFMDALNAEFQDIIGDSTMGHAPLLKAKQQQHLHQFQQKLGRLKFLDPACGSGNFLTETYVSLRRLENKVISALNKGEKVIGFEDFIHVKINQFYGIEINDFAVTVAKTALWIAESQMMAETEKILGMNLNFLPLTTNAFIVEGNALRMDWATLQPYDTDKGACPLVEVNEPNLFSGFTTQTDGKAHHYDYIIGNPPFVGYSLQSEEQKKDILSIYVDEKGKPYKTAGKIDYVAGWYFKAAQLINGTNTSCALVSTNSITQGEQVAAIWRPLFERFNIQIDFAWRTFRWDSESNQKAHVHCVIIGFREAKISSSRNKEAKISSSQSNCDVKNIASLRDVQNVASLRTLYNADGTITKARNINPYLIDADNVFIESRAKSLCDVPQMVYGNKPTDGGFLFLTEEERDEFLKKEPSSAQFVKQILGSEEFINNKKRYCIWLVGASPAEIKKNPTIFERVKNVRDFRLASTKEATRKSAETPMLFQEVRQPLEGNYLLVPRVSSENREYLPIGFMSHEIIVNDAVQIIPNATLYHFGILTSSVHMAWMRAVCGRLEMRYRYSKDIVYNNFVWPSREVKILSSHNISEVGNFTSMCASMYLDKNQDVNEHRAHLPHWHQDGKLQFITFRLADSLPQEKLDELEQNKERFMQQHPQPWEKETEAQYYKLFGSKIDEWLDAGMGSCLLKFPNIRKIVCDALSFFDGDRYRLHSYVVMPNHVHVLVELLGENKTGDVLHSWKRHTANQINKLIGGSGKFWQHESFDRIIRDKEHYNNVLRYIANNPRNLPEDSFSIYKEAKISSSHSCEVGNVASMEVKISSSHDCDVKNVASLREVENFASMGAKISSSHSCEVGNFASMIEQTAQAILDARALYPDSSLADLYDPVLMPVELRRAHQKNDEAVLAAYGWPKDLQESEIVARLFEMYEEMVKGK